MSELELAKQIAAEVVAANAEPVLRFTLEQGAEPGIFESKVGGTPYLPRDMAWPVDSKGMGMELLAQVDCAALEGLPDFPHTGLLQFFAALDDVFGVGFDDQTAQAGFRVLYHETADPSVTAEEVLAKKAKAPQPEGDNRYYTPVFGIYGVRFAPASIQHISEQDYRAWVQFLQKWNELHGTDFKTQWDYYKATKISREFPSPEGKAPWHQLGGYPYFTQEDPRCGDDQLADLDVLLFQLDSDMRKRDEGGDLVMWGDCGVGNFFINREALKRRDFSRVCYNWDCC